MRSARPPRGWRRRTLRLGSYRLIFQFDRFGRCTPDECGYGNFWCPKGCLESVPDMPDEEEAAPLFLEDLFDPR